MALWFRRLKGIGFDIAASSSLRSKIITPKPPVRAKQYMRPAILIAALIMSGTSGILYFRNVESVPYTKRKRFLPLPVDHERALGRSEFLKKKAKFEGKIVPEMDPDCVRVKMILKDVVIALHKGLRKEAAADSQSKGVKLGGFRVKMSLNFDASDSKQVKLASSHLEGLNWEVLMVKDDAVFACCLPGGKLIVFTGLLDQFDTNEELATVIAYEVAHVVARHYFEWFTRNLHLLPVITILRKSFIPERFRKSFIFQQDLHGARMAIEANYIGLLLMASAGYDPRVAPKVFKKMGQAWSESDAKSNYASTHPWGITQIELAYGARVMQEAISTYEETTAS